MGKITGFLEFTRELPEKRPSQERINDYDEFVQRYSDEKLNQQSGRCMDCGTPFCHDGCPVGNLIPEFNDAVYRKSWKEAYDLLSSTNNFPEFTGRICPAPCESSCVLGINQPAITIEEIEKHIIEIAFENGFVQPKIPNLRTGKKIAIVGPNADRCILGGYADIPKQTITPLQAISSELIAMSHELPLANGSSNLKAQSPKLIYAEGVHLTDEGNWFSENAATKATDPEVNRKNIKLAIEAVKDADIILYFGGANEVIYREGWSSTHSGDRPDIDLYGEQNELILALAKLKKPMVGFVFSGPPLACKTLDDNTDALVQCWFLGQETGDAVADLIFGKINPSGKLPITIPRSAGHIPAYYSYKPSAKRGYNLAETSPLYPFGHGLSYTTFDYSDLKISSPTIKNGQNVNVSVDVTNSGAVEGAEVVQLYIRDIVSSVTRPIKELKDFSKINLKPSEKKTVTFTITPNKLSFYNRDMKKIIEPGDFEIMIGTSSMVNQKIKFTIKP